jgi:hypothetical protein
MSLSQNVLVEHPEYLDYMRKKMNDEEAANIATAAMKDFFAPTTERCPSTIHFLPNPKIGEGKQEEGNNPMYIVDEFSTPFNPFGGASKRGSTYSESAPKNAAGAGAVASLTINAPEDTEQSQRHYLGHRAYEISYAKKNELEKQFFIYEPDGPKTAQETADRLKAGLYTVKVPKTPDDDEDEDFGGFYWRDVFSWRTPTTMPDKAGHKAAYEAFTKFYQDQLDIIRIASPADGLIALKALQDWKAPVTAPVVA